MNLAKQAYSRRGLKLGSTLVSFPFAINACTFYSFLPFSVAKNEQPELGFEGDVPSHHDPLQPGRIHRVGQTQRQHGQVEQDWPEGISRPGIQWRILLPIRPREGGYDKKGMLDGC